MFIPIIDAGIPTLRNEIFCLPASKFYLPFAFTRPRLSVNRCSLQFSAHGLFWRHRNSRRPSSYFLDERIICKYPAEQRQFGMAAKGKQQRRQLRWEGSPRVIIKAGTSTASVTTASIMTVSITRHDKRTQERERPLFLLSCLPVRPLRRKSDEEQLSIVEQLISFSPLKPALAPMLRSSVPL